MVLGYVRKYFKKIQRQTSGKYPYMQYEYRPHRIRRRYRAGLTSKVKSIVNGMAEAKFVDWPVNITTPILGTSIIHFMTGTSEGDSQVQREGEKIYLTSINLIGRVTSDPDMNIAGDTGCRLILFRANTNVNGVLPAVTDILESDDTVSLKNHEIKGDFSVYMDKRFIIRSPLVTNANATASYNLSYYKRFKSPKMITYDGAGAVIANAEKGHWFLLMMSDCVQNQSPTWTINIRLRFKDI